VTIYDLYSWRSECWKCKLNTPRVIAANPDYQFNAVDVDDKLGNKMGEKFPYFQKKRGVWENWCTHCDAIQGNFYVKTEEWFVEKASQCESVQEMISSGMVTYEGEITIEDENEELSKLKYAYHPVDWVFEAKRECFKCKKSTPVVFTASPYLVEDRVREPSEASSQVLAKRFSFWKKSMNKTQGKEVWSNHCLHCGLIQGNGFVRQLFQDALDDANNNMMIAQDRGTLMICDTIEILHVRKYTEKGHCELCSKKLQPIKDNRANGGMGSDWKGRRFHIKCWKTLNEADY
jgi:hypothetical protein